MRLPVASLVAPPLRWIARAALPDELRAALAEFGSLEAMAAPAGALWSMPVGVFGLAAMVLGGAAGPDVLTSELPAFAAPSRVVLIATITSLLLFALVWRRVRASRRPAMFLAPTALVLVDAHAVAVLPAEHVTQRDGVYQYGDHALSKRGETPRWADDLTERIDRARFDEGARREDPWRALIAQTTSQTASAARRREILVGGAMALAGGAIAACVAEYGVLRSQRQREARATASQRRYEASNADRDWQRRSARLNDLWDRTATLTLAEAHELLRLGGRDSPVCARLQQLCAARFPMEGVAPEARIFRQLQRARCTHAEGFSYVATEVVVEEVPGITHDGDWLNYAPTVATRAWLTNRLAEGFRALGDNAPVTIIPVIVRPHWGHSSALWCNDGYEAVYTVTVRPIAAAANADDRSARPRARASVRGELHMVLYSPADNRYLDNALFEPDVREFTIE